MIYKNLKKLIYSIDEKKLLFLSIFFLIGLSFFLLKPTTTSAEMCANAHYCDRGGGICAGGGAATTCTCAYYGFSIGTAFCRTGPRVPGPDCVGDGGSCAGAEKCDRSACSNPPPTVCIPDGSCTASAPACGSVTYGVDNCGTSCSKTGVTCPPPPPPPPPPPTICVPDGSCTASAPACGSTTYGVNNCGTSCSKTGVTCPLPPRPPVCVSNGSCSALPPACGVTTYGWDNCGTSCHNTGVTCPPAGTCNDYNSCTVDSGTYPYCSNINVPVQGYLTPFGGCDGACGGGSGYKYRSCAGNSCSGNCDGASLYSSCTNSNPCTSAIDLTAGSASPSTGKAGVPIQFTALITNSGTQGTGASFSNFFQVIDSSSGAITGLSPTTMSALTPSASNTATSPYYVFPSAGIYTVRACADKANKDDMYGVIPESNESNNCSTSWTTVTVGPASSATANINANPSTIPYNTSSLITWSSTSASSCIVTPESWTGVSGSKSTVNLKVDSVYTVSCDSGAAIASAFIRVLPKVITFDVTVTPSQGGIVKSTDGLIDCGVNCTHTYNSGDTVTLVPYTQSASWKFVGWTRDCLGKQRGMDGHCSLTVDSPKQTTAIFTPKPIYIEF